MSTIHSLKLAGLMLAVSLTACTNPKTNPIDSSKTIETKKPISVEIPVNTGLLLSYLNETGDYVNSKQFPSLIKAPIVFEELGKNNLVIDIRKPDDYKKGHIKGAVNVNFSDIPNYFQSKIKPFEYDKIIVVCSTGQYASYTVSLLRLMGYGNVYAMRWGMSAWNREVANENWLKGVSSMFEDQLQTTDVAKPEAGSFPDLKSDATKGEQLLQSRMDILFKAGLDNTTISADSVFKNPSAYFIINFERKDKYDGGHIPGAVRYKPTGTLGIVNEMATIPANKDVVVYCGTGHNSGFVTAYLNLFGYKARTLDFGNNSFMYNKMKKENESLSWVTFSASDIHNFPIVK
jgi:rhodanese-related sulfurtransferase